MKNNTRYELSKGTNEVPTMAYKVSEIRTGRTGKDTVLRVFHGTLGEMTDLLYRVRDSQVTYDFIASAVEAGKKAYREYRPEGVVDEPFTIEQSDAVEMDRR